MPLEVAQSGYFKLDKAGDLWTCGALHGKVSGAFKLMGTQHGWQEVALFSSLAQAIVDVGATANPQTGHQARDTHRTKINCAGLPDQCSSTKSMNPRSTEVETSLTVSACPTRSSGSAPVSRPSAGG